MKTEGEINAQGYRKAMQLVYDCSRKEGFLASPTDSDNYRRIWARDGVIVGLAALMSAETALIDTFRATLETLAGYQGPHGEIPSNVDPGSGRVSFGGMTGRVDADLWFVIGCGEYWKETEDEHFIGRMLPAINKVRFLLGAWEYNNRGLLYVPATGDWADEYIQSGYVLYDQLLYLQALRTIATLRSEREGATDHDLMTRNSRLKHLIRANYWFEDGDDIPDDVYHEIIYKKARKAADRCAKRYWLPFFSPHGYGYRFDGFANVLASLLDVADDDIRRSVDRYISDEIIQTGIHLLPAFHPVIKPVDGDWEELKITFSYHFKNRPYEFQNGGLWPMVTGFYCADLARRGKRDLANRFLNGIHTANAMEMGGKPWAFPEYVHGRELTPGGTRCQCWSAAAAIMGHQSLNGKPIFRITP
jgi:glycogen debranching enzyme